jgi:hypothetical protein
MSLSNVLRGALVAAAVSATMPCFGQPIAVARPADTAGAKIAPLPAQAIALQARLAPKLSPTARGWVQDEAKTLAGRRLNADPMLAMARKDVEARFAGQKLSATDIDAMVTLVMTQIATDAENDLRAQMAAMEAATKKKQAQRDAADAMKDKKDSLGDMSQQDQMVMQMYMDRRSKAEEALSNILMKSGDASAAIVGNLK